MNTPIIHDMNNFYHWLNSPKPQKMANRDPDTFTSILGTIYGGIPDKNKPEFMDFFWHKWSTRVNDKRFLTGALFRMYRQTPRDQRSKFQTSASSFGYMADFFDTLEKEIDREEITKIIRRKNIPTISLGEHDVSHPDHYPFNLSLIQTAKTRAIPNGSLMRIQAGCFTGTAEMLDKRWKTKNRSLPRAHLRELFRKFGRNYAEAGELSNAAVCFNAARVVGKTHMHKIHPDYLPKKLSPWNRRKNYTPLPEPEIPSA